MQKTSLFTRFSLVALAALMALPMTLASGCFAVITADVEIYAPDPPPADRVEVRTQRPGSRHAWKKGRWVWRSRANRYVWVPGGWARVRHPHHRHWVPGRWVHSSRGYQWHQGRWR
ncbi:MAG TPA: hypothetical protein EYN06_10020 [Myxococcales bacterium]|nr:hypothetical protein [Myxococcales bacterium]HIN86806.1 hypothetical protein [Myxococcales bacterium]